MDESVKVTEIPASRGVSWLVGSWRLFAAAPMAWIGLCAGWMAVTFALVIIPFAGLVAAHFLQPAFFASFAIAAYRQTAGERIVMNDLFAGFRRNFRSLVNLGAILLMAKIVVFAGMALLGLPLLETGYGEPNVDLAEVAEALAGKEWILFLGMSLLAMVEGALWFAPQLIAFQGMGTGQAIRWSAYASISNVGALVVYGVSVVVMLFLAIVPYALGLIVAVPLMAISTYIGYREVFESPRPQ
jgi:uncharacterized membrane protein